MGIDDEFATIDVILASKAETRGVDAFALALIKAERQMRKLFTYLVFQSEAFDAGDVEVLRNVLASRRVYFLDFVLAWDKLSTRPFKEIFGPDFDRLYALLTKAIEYRNKIFHGQLTADHLSREDLVAYVTQIKEWCRILANGAQVEIGYDGFGRNSFRKSEPAFASHVIAKMATIHEYDQFLAEMEREHQKKNRSARGSALPPNRSLASEPRENDSVRSLNQIPLGKVLIEKFPDWLAYFERHGPFSKRGQLEYHVETISRRNALGSAAAAVTDELFLRGLYNTLRAWGIGARRSRLKSFDEFAAIFGCQKQTVAQFETIVLDDPQLDVASVTDALWTLLLQLPIVENVATLVPVTKALHHVLPDLVVPMDRECTQVFFGWQNPQFQYGQRQCFTEAFNVFAQVARAVKPSQYVGKGWNSSRTKVIDNALVGLVQSMKDRAKSA